MVAYNTENSFIDEIVEKYEKDVGQIPPQRPRENGAKVVARAWTDPD